MMKITLKNKTLFISIQPSLTDDILVNVFDYKKRLLFDLIFECEPVFETLVEEITLKLYPKKNIEEKNHHQEDFNLLGDLFTPSLFTNNQDEFKG